jgi:hypothetical protein
VSCLSSWYVVLCIAFLSGILCRAVPFCPLYCAVSGTFIRYFVLFSAFFCPIYCVVYTVYVQYIVLNTVSLTVGGCPPPCLLSYSLSGPVWPLTTSTKRVSLAKFIITNIHANGIARPQEGSMIEGMWEGDPIDGSSFRCPSITHCFEKYSMNILCSVLLLSFLEYGNVYVFSYLLNSRFTPFRP